MIALGGGFSYFLATLIFSAKNGLWRLLCWQILVGMKHWHLYGGWAANQMFWCTFAILHFSSDGIFFQLPLPCCLCPALLKYLEGIWLVFPQNTTVVWPIIASVAHCCTIVTFVCALWGSDRSWDMQQHLKKGESENWCLVAVCS